jgi:YgiT-type zinc finger domain-containing protein
MDPVKMFCDTCREREAIEELTTITREKDGQTIVFKHVPAMICQNCGEVYLDIEDCIRIEDFLETLQLDNDSFVEYPNVA